MKVTFTAGQRVQYAGTGDFFRLLSTTAAVTVEFYKQGREIAERVDVEAGFAEQFRTVEFDRVDIYSATAQTVQWEVALGSEIRYDRGAATISGSVDLNAATQNALIRPLGATQSHKVMGALAANAVETIFAPGANTNGVILLTAGHAGVGSAGLSYGTFIAKAGAAPVSNVDGEIVCGVDNFSDAGGYREGGKLPGPQFISAGMGLYFVISTAAASCQRHARWRVL
jgi:hypothetical protein